MHLDDDAADDDGDDDDDDDDDGHLLFWYQVLTWVSVKPSFAASSIRS